jgi:hypothetical protein
MPEREPSERHVEISDADERVVDLEEVEDVVPPVDDAVAEAEPVTPTDEVVE